ncbi:hypothetical protein [Marinobacterium litorale]|uniref:hypothetical protein n=1 Tax=Marinobacterium litorale TaxID=404770 RepID=UPI0004803F32|nr:hypothetical protein [Marinobacterium litorale]
MPIPITFYVNEAIGVEAVQSLCGELESAGFGLSFTEYPNRPAAALEWLLPTGVVFFMAKKYLETLAEAAAKDHYPAIKSFITEKIQPRFIGPDAEKMVMMMPGGNVKDTGPFSRTFSVSTKVSNSLMSIEVKLLFKENTEPEELTEGLSAFSKLFSQHEEGELMEKLIAMDQGRSWAKVVWFNPESKAIELIDAVQSGKEKRLVSKSVERT